ncbi:MAG: hypothetical protein SFU86_22810 [Pirellulaceae bacterium]|nr:hypothetical protein [Pirellulaceae bacterium]
MRFDAPRRHCAAGWLIGPTLAAVLVVTGCLPAANRPARPVAIPAKAPVEPKSSQPVETSPISLTWEEIDLGMEPDSVYQPWMRTARVRDLEGKTVRITGYMCGAIFQKANIREFPLMRELECPFGPGGQAHHVIEVQLQGNLRTNFTTEPVTATGIFSIRPYTGPNGKTWSLYHLEATEVE